MARYILELRRLEWLPLHNGLDYILWAPREFNAVADHAVNATMDCGSSWEIGDARELSKAVRNRRICRICSDGGVRSEQLSAIGFVIMVANPCADGQVQAD